MFHIPVDVFAADLSLLVWLWFPPGACELLHVAIRVSSCPYASPIFQRFARTTRGFLSLRGEKRENLAASLSSLLCPLSSLRGKKNLGPEFARELPPPPKIYIYIYIFAPRYATLYWLELVCWVFSGSFFIFQQYSLSVVASGSYSYPISLLFGYQGECRYFWLPILMQLSTLMQLVIWHVRLCTDSATTCFKTEQNNLSITAFKTNNSAHITH